MPYIDFSGEKILQRTISVEVLRQAFEKLPNPLPYRGASNHGAFGASDEWAHTYADDIEEPIVSEIEADQIVARLGLYRHRYCSAQRDKCFC